MDESHEHSRFSCSVAQPHHRPRTFSLAVLFRLITLSGLIMGWSALARAVEPLVAMAMILAAGVVLAMVVGGRRKGAPPARFLAALWFAVGGLAIACYTGLVSVVVQNPITERYKWADLDEMASWSLVVAGFPLVLAISLFMLRSWIWSAHDQALRRQAKMSLP